MGVAVVMGKAMQDVVKLIIPIRVRQQRLGFARNLKEIFMISAPSLPMIRCLQHKKRLFSTWQQNTGVTSQTNFRIE